MRKISRNPQLSNSKHEEVKDKDLRRIICAGPLIDKMNSTMGSAMQVSITE